MKAVFKTPHLVQRLLKPYERMNKFEEGIIVKKGLVGETADIIGHIMDFQYMGSAEFEWGALPKSLEYAIRYAKDDDYVSCEIDVFSHNSNIHPVFYICHKDMEEQVVSWIIKAAKNLHPRCKEGVGLQNSIDNKDKHDPQMRSFVTVGWYDLENRFWFFTDRKMFLDVKRLFGV